MVCEGISFNTKLQAPITHPSPISTPPRITEHAPITVFFLIIGAFVSAPVRCPRHT